MEDVRLAGGIMGILKEISKMGTVKSDALTVSGKTIGEVAAEAPAPDAPAPEAPAPAYIGMDAAKEIALSHAGLSAADVRFEDAELDWERGKAVYELDFRSGRYEFEYEIDALSGEVLNFEKEIDD